MKNNYLSKFKRTISGILALAMTASLTSVMPATADTPVEPVSHTYSGDGYEVRYDVTGGWADNRNVQVMLTNTGDEPLQNWALKYDVQGEIVNIWNGTVAASGDDWSIIKNTGYNYEIQPKASTSFGYIVRGSDIDIPAAIELCSKRVDSDAADYSVSLAVESEWDTGFTGNVKIENTGDAPLEAWRLSFDTNFDLEDVWNASVISSESNHYTISNSYATASIAVGETVTFGIRGTKKAGKSLVLSDISMTEMSISADFTDTKKPDDSSSETDSSSEADSSSETDSSSEVDSSSETESSSVIDSTPDESSSSETDSKPDEDTGYISVVAYGAYNVDESAIDIEWYTETAGTYEVLESSDNENYTSVIEVSDFTTYRYHITEDFDTKYFKVKVTSGKKSAESIPFVVKKNAEGYSVELIDTDSDGLADLYEEILGTDKTKPDTDDDGLSDYQEIYLTGTDPLVYDSVTAGISDAEADSDNDGLSNIEEIELGTEPSSDDTDGDKLGDGEEVNEYGTDPLIVDTDEDGLSDYEEVSLKLDPLNGSSDGKTSDKDKKFVQTVGEDSDAFTAINTEDNPFKVSMKISASGLACENLDSGKSGYANVIQNDAVLGIIPEFTYTEGLSVNDVEIYFNIDEKYTANTNGKYSAVSDEFEGIKRFQVFKYFDDIDMLLPIETTYDEENHTVSTHVDELGTYCLFDMETWLESIDVDPSEFELITLSPDPMGMVGLTVRKNQIMAASDKPIGKKKIDIVLQLFLRTATSDAVKEEAKLLASSLFDKNGEFKNCDLHVYVSTYTGTPVGYDYATNETDLISKITSVAARTTGNRPVIENSVKKFFNKDDYIEYELRDDAIKYYIAIESDVVECNNETVLFNLLDNHDMTFVIVSNTGVALDHDSVTRDTDGAVFNTSEANPTRYSDAVYTFIKESAGLKDSSNVYKTVTATGWRSISLDKPITKDYKELAKDFEDAKLRNKLISEKGPFADTDRDGLYDFEEIRFYEKGWFFDKDLIGFDNNGQALLPTLAECMELKNNLPYVERGMSDYLRSSSISKKIHILPINSDPTNYDSDCDYIPDIKEELGNRLKSNSIDLVDKDLDDSKSIEGYNPSQSNKYIGERALFHSTLIPNSEYTKNQYTFIRKQLNNGFDAQFRISPEKSSYYSITVSNINVNKYNANNIVKVYYLKKGKRNYIERVTDENVLEQIDSDLKVLINGNEVTYNFMLDNETNSDYIIEVDNTSYVKTDTSNLFDGGNYYAISISQNNWVYAPYGGKQEVIPYDFYFEMEKMFIPSDTLIEAIRLSSNNSTIINNNQTETSIEDQTTAIMKSLGIDNSSKLIRDAVLTVVSAIIAGSATVAAIVDLEPTTKILLGVASDGFTTYFLVSSAVGVFNFFEANDFKNACYDGNLNVIFTKQGYESLFNDLWDPWLTSNYIYKFSNDSMNGRVPVKITLNQSAQDVVEYCGFY